LFRWEAQAHEARARDKVEEGPRECDLFRFNVPDEVVRHIPHDPPRLGPDLLLVLGKQDVFHFLTVGSNKQMVVLVNPAYSERMRP
jgi:hypothetical protein